MDAVACRAAADEGGERECRAATPAGGGQSSAGKRSVFQGTTVRPTDEINQVFPLGKRASSGGMAATSALFHVLLLYQHVASRNFHEWTGVTIRSCVP